MDDASNPLAVEVRSEQAHTLFVTTTLLDQVLRELERVTAGGLNADGLDREALLVEARDRLWGLLVQREALGIVHHQALYEVLRVPDEVRALASHQVGRKRGAS